MSLNDDDFADWLRLMDSDQFMSIEGQASAGSTVIPNSDANGGGSSAGGPSGQQPLSKREQKKPKYEFKPPVEAGCSSGRTGKPSKRTMDQPADDDEERELQRILKQQKLVNAILEEKQRTLHLQLASARVREELAALERQQVQDDV